MREGKYKYHGQDVPLFTGTSLHVCVGHNLNEVYKATDIAGGLAPKGYEPEHWGAIAFEADRNDNHGVFVLLRPDAKPSIIAHEAVHLANYILSHAGVKLDPQNDEPQAYLVGWLVDEIHYALTSKDVKPKKTIKLR